MADNNGFTPPPKTILNHFKLRLKGEKVNGADRAAELAFEVFGSNPRIAVYYNDKQTKNSYARMDPESFMYFLQCMEDVAMEKRKAIKIKNRHTHDGNGNKLPKPDFVSQTILARDDKGEIFISVVEKDKTPVKFYFQTNFWWDVVDEQNQPVAQNELSSAICLGRAKFMRELMTQVMTAEYVPPKPREGGYGNQNRSQGKSGGNWGGNGGGNKAPAGGDMFDDIAM